MGCYLINARADFSAGCQTQKKYLNHLCSWNKIKNFNQSKGLFCILMGSLLSQLLVSAFWNKFAVFWMTSSWWYKNIVCSQSRIHLLFRWRLMWEVIWICLGFGMRLRWLNAHLAVAFLCPKWVSLTLHLWICMGKDNVEPVMFTGHWFKHKVSTTVQQWRLLQAWICFWHQSQKKCSEYYWDIFLPRNIIKPSRWFSLMLEQCFLQDYFIIISVSIAISLMERWNTLLVWLLGCQGKQFSLCTLQLLMAKMSLPWVWWNVWGYCVILSTSRKFSILLSAVIMKELKATCPTKLKMHSEIFPIV